VRREKAWYFSRCNSYPAKVAPAGSYRSGGELCDAIGEQTSSRRTQMDEEEMVGRLNRKLRGWVNYFDLGSVGRAYGVVNYHVTSRLRRWLCRKHKVRGLVLRPA
jgi:hypothetical protein